MLTKDQTKWNFEIVSNLIEGPLLNPKRLEEAIKVSKWGKRLMTFFHPFNHRFSDLPKTKVCQVSLIRGSYEHITQLTASRQIHDGFAWGALCWSH